MRPDARPDSVILTRVFPIAAAAVLLTASSAPAQTVGGDIALYGWVPSITGEVTTKSGRGGDGRSTETSMDGDDFLTSLEFGFLSAAEVHYGRFALVNAITYASLNTDGTVGRGARVAADVDTKGLLTTTGIGYRAYDEGGLLLEPYVGIKYVWLKTEVTAKWPGQRGLTLGADVDVHWWDPAIGVRGQVPVSENWSVGGVAEIAGFGVGSDLTWQIYAGVEYALSQRFSLNAGYRYLSIDYSTDRAKVDVDQYGPVLGLTMRF